MIADAKIVTIVKVTSDENKLLRDLDVAEDVESILKSHVSESCMQEASKIVLVTENYAHIFQRVNGYKYSKVIQTTFTGGMAVLLDELRR